MIEELSAEGAVSLWIGQADSESALVAYADCDSAQFTAATLADDFGTGRYDHDFMDASVETPTRSLRQLLQGCSFDSLVIPKFVELCGDLIPPETNAFVLLYNFRHRGLPGQQPRTDGPVKLRYVGSITVPTPWHD